MKTNYDVVQFEMDYNGYQLNCAMYGWDVAIVDLCWIKSCDQSFTIIGPICNSLKSRFSVKLKKKRSSLKPIAFQLENVYLSYDLSYDVFKPSGNTSKNTTVHIDWNEKTKSSQTSSVFLQFISVFIEQKSL